MKIYIMTDLEGAAGVIDREHYVLSESRYYEKAKELLTLETNAAIAGFFEAGATEVLVADGHGEGGLLPELLDERVQYQRGFPDPYPFGLDDSFDVMAWVGQHAKAGTPFSHICHTGNQYVIDASINGVSVGEFGMCALCGAELGVVPIFGAGDEAFCAEARALTPGIETVAVKRGLQPGTGEECDFETYKNRFSAAVHLSPVRARRLIRAGAAAALTRFSGDPGSFRGVKLDPPYELVTRYRPGTGRAAFTEVKRDEKSVIDMLNSRGKVL